VAVGGDDLLNDCTNSGTPCATVPYAASLATAGEVVSVGPGTFAGTVTLGQAVTLRGAQAGIAVGSRTAGSAAETVIDGRGLPIAIVISSGGVTIEGLDVVGDAQTHTGVLCSPASSTPPATSRPFRPRSTRRRRRRSVPRRTRSPSRGCGRPRRRAARASR
jgi:hypothetical protein